MSTATLATIVEPLVKRKLFATTEEAVRKLMQDYTLRQVSSCQRQIAKLERKYGMNFTKFTQYLHERGGQCYNSKNYHRSKDNRWEAPSWQKMTIGWIGK